MRAQSWGAPCGLFVCTLYTDLRNRIHRLTFASRLRTPRGDTNGWEISKAIDYSNHFKGNEVLYIVVLLKNHIMFNRII